jgi:hypothetical protein
MFGLSRGSDRERGNEHSEPLLGRSSDEHIRPGSNTLFSADDDDGSDDDETPLGGHSRSEHHVRFQEEPPRMMATMPLRSTLASREAGSLRSSL